MPDCFQDKIVWIIGASSGIGADLARELSRRGARLVLSARREEKLKELASDLTGQADVLSLDVTDRGNFIKATQDIKEKHGRIDSIIFMAGVYTPSPIQDIDMDQADQIISVNFNGALNCIHAVLPHLVDGAQIALCASVAGYRGLPNGQPYCATKAAVINLAESLRAEQGHRFDVKVINPGFVKTPLTEKNEFPMPMAIESVDAARYLADGLQRKAFEIHFPKQFTVIMKILELLPRWLYFKLVRKMV